MRGTRFAKVLLLAVCLAAMPVRGAKSEHPEVLERLQLWLDGTRELEADFKQTLLSGALGAGPVESGRLYLRRPGRMRWDYRMPERKVALVLGERTRLYVEEERQLWEGRLESSETILPSLLASDRTIDEIFASRVLATPRRGGEGAFLLSLVPRAADHVVEGITVTVRPPEYGIEVIEVQDAAGNRILYEFSAIRRNTGLAPGVFEFVPPPGTETVALP